MCNERNDEMKLNESEEIERDINIEGFVNDEVLIENTYDEKYKQAVEEIIENLNRKNKKRDRVKKSIVIGTFIFAFSAGFFTNYFVNSKFGSNTKLVSYELNENNNNGSSKDNGSDDSKKNEGFKEENDNNKKKSEKENLTIEEVVKKVSPAVVTISVSSQGNMFTQGKQGVGTGFIVDENGTVVTNYHVINGATNIIITFNDGTEVTGKVVATSRKDDLAILDIIEEVKMPGIAQLDEDDEVNAGQEVVAIGNPLGKEFSGSVTKGIVSSPKRIVNMDGFDKEFIQIDAAINPGNSGGPLINLKGEIIGVNTAKQGGENVEGIGFAVPIKYLRAMLDNPEKYTNEDGQNSQGQFYWNQGGYPGSYPNGEYPGGYPGGGYQGGGYPGGYSGSNPGGQYPDGGFNDEEQYRGEQNTNGVKLGIQILETEKGLVVVGVEGGSVAERTGIQLNDIIVGIQGINVTSANELKRQLSLLQSGQSIELNVQRDGEVITLSAII